MGKISTYLNPLSDYNLAKYQPSWAERYKGKSGLGKMLQGVVDVVRGGYSGIKYLMNLNSPSKEQQDMLKKARAAVAHEQSHAKTLTQTNTDTYQASDEGMAGQELRLEAKTLLTPLINRFRALQGRAGLSFSEDLCSSAKQELKTGVQNPEWRKKHTHSQAIMNGRVGEIITSGFRTIDEALKNFMESPLHRWYLQREDFSSFGYEFVQGEDGRNYLVMHFGLKEGANGQDKPDENVLKITEETRQKDQSFYRQSQEEVKEYWKNRAKDIKPSESTEQYLNERDLQSYQMRVLLSGFEQFAAKVYPDVTLEMTHELPDKLQEKRIASYGALTLSNGEKKVTYLIDPMFTALIIPPKGLLKMSKAELNKKLQPQLVSFDQVFAHFAKAESDALEESEAEPVEEEEGETTDLR